MADKVANTRGQTSSLFLDIDFQVEDNGFGRPTLLANRIKKP